MHAAPLKEKYELGADFTAQRAKEVARSVFDDLRKKGKKLTMADVNKVVMCIMLCLEKGLHWPVPRSEKLLSQVHSALL